MKQVRGIWDENFPLLDDNYSFAVTSSFGGRFHSSRINDDPITGQYRNFAKDSYANPRIYPFRI